MRTTDDMHECESFRPFGPKVEKPAAPAPAPKPEGPSGLVTEDGKLRTTSHKPYLGCDTLEEAIQNWRQVYAEEHDLDFLP
jgi:hypothetical protein